LAGAVEDDIGRSRRQVKGHLRLAAGSRLGAGNEGDRRRRIGPHRPAGWIPTETFDPHVIFRCRPPSFGMKLKFLQLNPYHARKFLSSVPDIDLISAILTHSIEPLQ
jgi:hypothetical protein